MDVHSHFQAQAIACHKPKPLLDTTLLYRVYLSSASQEVKKYSLAAITIQVPSRLDTHKFIYGNTHATTQATPSHRHPSGGISSSPAQLARLLPHCIAKFLHSLLILLDPAYLVRAPLLRLAVLVERLEGDRYRSLPLALQRELPQGVGSLSPT